MAELLIVRHGQCEDGAAGVLNGRRDMPLTEKGRQQAAATATFLADVVNGRTCTIYSSTQTRASETAEIIRKNLGLNPFLLFPAIRERHLGVFTGKTSSEALAIVDPNDIIYTYHTTYAENTERYGCESFADTDRRVGAFALYAQSTHPDESELVVAVMHGDSGHALAGVSSGSCMAEMIQEFSFGNGEVVRVAGAGQVEKLDFVPVVPA